MLSVEQEMQFVKYILLMEESLYGCTLVDIRRIVFEFCEINHIEHPFNKALKSAGKDWALLFLKRHQSLSVRKPEALSMQRAQGMAKSEVEKCYAFIEKAITENGLTANTIFNMDETGINNVHRPPKIIAQKWKATVHAVTSGERGKRLR